MRDYRFWIATVVLLYTLIGFLVVPLVAKKQIVSNVKKMLGCDATVATIRFNPYTFNSSVRGFQLSDRRGEALASFDRLDVNLAPWPLVKRVVALESVDIAAPTLAVSVRGDRTINLMDLVPVPAGTARESAPVERSAAMWVVRVDRLDVRSMRLTYDDATVTPAAHAVIDSLDATITSFSAVPGDTMQFVTRLLSHDGGQVRASGFAIPLDGVVNARLDVDSLVITAAAPYLARFAYLDLRDGKVNVHGDVQALAKPGVAPDTHFTGDLVVDDLELFDTLKNQDFFGFDRLAVLKAQAGSQPPAAHVEEIDMKGIYARIAIAEDHSFNVNDVFAPARALADSVKASGAAAAGADSAPAKPPMPDVAIGRIRIDGGRIDFSDLSLPLPFAAHVHAVDGEVTAIAPDNAAGSRLLVEGTVDSTGFAKASGFVNLFDPVAFTDIDVSFRNIEMTTMTPYSGKFAGYRIRKGKLSLTLSYDIENSQLKADHKILLEKLTLGEKVESPDAVSLPIKLAVALLKDKHGNIDLDLQVHGDLNDPKVNTASLVWQALKKVITKVAMAPFRFLGNLIGVGGGDDMEFVEFEPGRGNLTPPQHERLGTLAKALMERPTLKLQVRGAYDKRSDALAIQIRRFEDELAARLLASTGGDSAAARAIENDPSSGRMQTTLEALVTEALGADKLAAMRAAHTNTTAAPTPAPAPTPTLDLAGYFKSMRDGVIATQPVNDADLTKLAASRSAAIRGYLVERAAIPAGRVELLESDVHDDGDEWIRCKLALEGMD